MKWPGLQWKKSFFPISEREYKWKPSLQREVDIWTSPGALVSHHVKARKPFALNTQLPFNLTVYQGQSQGLSVGSLFPSLGTGLFTPPSRLAMSLSAQRGKKTVWDLTCRQQFSTRFSSLSLPKALLWLPRKAARSLSEKMDRWIGFWFHSPAGCFPHYNSLILAFPWDYRHVLPSCISTLRKAQKAQAARARSRPSPARTGKSIQARSPVSSCL